MLTTILIGIIWFFIGLWICYKRDWYYLHKDPITSGMFAVIFAPINLIITFIQVYCIDKWNN